MTKVYVLVAHNGATERVLVTDGVIQGGANHGARLDNIEGMYAQVLRLTVQNTSAMEETRAKHARILAGIAEEVARG